MLSLLDALPEDSPFLTLDPPQRRQRTLEALQRLLLRESQVQPLLLVFEDLHWIDAETQALLNSLVESLPTTRLLLLVNYRPEYQHGWGSKTYYTQLRLDSLPSVSADEFLQLLLGNNPNLGPLKQLLIVRTEGNPFFLEESTRTLVEAWGLVGKPDAYRLAKPLEGLQMPATAQAVLAALAAAVDRLPAEEKSVFCKRPQSLAPRCPCPCCRPLPNYPRQRCTLASHTCKLLSSSTRSVCSPSAPIPSNMPSRTKWCTGVYCRSGARPCMPRLSTRLETLAGDRRDEQVDRLAQHAFRGEVWATAPPSTAGRLGPGRMPGLPTEKP